VGEIMRELCRQREVELVERSTRPDHVHMCLSIPPKFSVAFVAGSLKGKSAVRIHRMVGERRLTGLYFWSRAYYVSTTGLDDSIVASTSPAGTERHEQGELDFK
jgi:putative transposase